MRRLRDDAASDEPVAREMARLLRHAEKAEPGPFAEDRVRARIAAGTRRPRRPLVRGYALAALLLLMTFASAWAIHRASRHREAASVLERTSSTSPSVPMPVAPPEPVLPVTAEVASKKSRPARPAPRLADPPVAPSTFDSTPADPRPTEEEAALERAGLVVRARVALRREHAPQTTLRLVDEYLDQNPNGPVVEEALELRIEAQAALGNASATAKAAREYLARFPSGRFTDFAIRSQSAPP